MENDSTLVRPSVPMDYQRPQIVTGGKRASYYIAITIVLLTVWLVRSRKRTSNLELPAYKASKTKWIFDAETLIKDSYIKV